MFRNLYDGVPIHLDNLLLLVQHDQTRPRHCSERPHWPARWWSSTWRPQPHPSSITRSKTPSSRSWRANSLVRYKPTHTFVQLLFPNTQIIQCTHNKRTTVFNWSVSTQYITNTSWLRNDSSWFLPSSCCCCCFQLNPSKLEKNEDVNLNLAHLLNILSELVEKIFMAAEILPP